VNIASNYLIAGQEAGRHGTSHPSIVPYQVFPCKDGFIMIGAGNEGQVGIAPTRWPCMTGRLKMVSQFKKLVESVLRMPGLLKDPRFANNHARVENRDALVKIITDVLAQNTRDHWLAEFEGLG